MRAYVVKEWTHPSKLTLVHDAPEPVPEIEEVVVDIYSAALNFFDVSISLVHMRTNLNISTADPTSPG
jgi:NADPH:quinone reductase-like Zn-dependent oxidoreductase